MKKFLFLSGMLLFLFACNESFNKKVKNNQKAALAAKIYHPGFGDFMGNLQKHHQKLWFAGIEENWDLADFYCEEIDELIEDIESFHAGRKETNSLKMIFPSIEQVENAIDAKNIEDFKEAYLQLTKTCNSCHAATDHEFIVIKVPSNNPFDNQDFNLQ